MFEKVDVKDHSLRQEMPYLHLPLVFVDHLTASARKDGSAVCVLGLIFFQVLLVEGVV